MNSTFSLLLDSHYILDELYEILRQDAVRAAFDDKDSHPPPVLDEKKAIEAHERLKVL